MKRDCLPQVLVAHLGSRMHYAVPAVLQRAGMLASFVTDIYVGRGSAWHLGARGVAALLPDILRPAVLRRLLSRQENEIPGGKVTAHNLLGLRFSTAARQAGGAAELEQVYLTYSKRFCDLVLKNDFQGVDAVYAYRAAALPLFQKAKQLNLYKILEQYSAPTRIESELLREEHQRWPGWEAPYPEPYVWQRRLDLEEQEWALADMIICPSLFVAGGLESLGVPPEKIKIVSYGVKISGYESRASRPWDGGRPLRALFVGKVNLGKGSQYLYQALKKLNSGRINTRFVGPVYFQNGPRRLLEKYGTLTGEVARNEVYGHYEWGDIFVLPSVCEGSAIVTYEALAAGLPVITTPNAGSLVREGQDGFIIPIRDAESLAEKLQLLAGQPELLAWMSQNARQRAVDFSWQVYGEKLAAAITQTLLSSKDNETGSWQ